MSCQQIVMSSSFFQFLAIMEQSGSWIPDILPKMLFCKKKCWHQQNQEGPGTKRYIFWNYVCVVYMYIPTKFHVSSIILMSFRRGNFNCFSLQFQCFLFLNQISDLSLTSVLCLRLIISVYIFINMILNKTDGNH